MKKPVLEEMLKEKGFTFKEDDDFEKISEAICATANHYSTQIMDAIGNIQSMDMPVIIVALRQLTRAMEKIDPKCANARLTENHSASNIFLPSTMTAGDQPAISEYLSDSSNKRDNINTKGASISEK